MLYDIVERIGDLSLPFEEWRSVTDYPSYFVSSQGRVISVSKRIPKIMNPTIKGSFCKIVLYDKNRRSSFYINRLVAREFLDSFDPRCIVGHYDNNPENNRLDNLYISNNRNILLRPCISITTKSRFRSGYECSEKLGIGLHRLKSIINTPYSWHGQKFRSL